MNWMRFRCIGCLVALFLFRSVAAAQSHEQWNSSEILNEMERLNTTARVLYLAAHPDDENTRMISWLNRGMHVETAYLSITRGDGGQNLIGPELREGLGVIRSHELMEARKLDGGKQFFTSANDFGFSKSVDETLEFWDENQVLSDMVWVIRNFRPNVIITRFSPEIGPRATHGHHTASAQLAIKAAKLAADPKSFSEQLRFCRTWSTHRIMWNTSWWFYGNEQVFDSMMQQGAVLKVDVGGFNPLLGESYAEIAARARSCHRSQGFGSSGVRGEVLEYLQLLDGAAPNGDLFSGIPLRWSETDGGAPIDKLLDKAMKQFDTRNPSDCVPLLLEARQHIVKLMDEGLKKDKLKQIDQIILQCIGFYALAGVDDLTYTAGSAMNINFEVVNRSVGEHFKLNSLRVNGTLIPLKNEVMSLQPGKKESLSFVYKLPIDHRPSQPYWLQEPYSKGMYVVKDLALTGTDFNKPAIQLSIQLEIKGQLMDIQIPVVMHKTDPAKGELIEPVHIVPEVVLQVDKPVYVFQTGKPQKVQVRVRSFSDSVSGYVELNLPDGWKSNPAFESLSLVRKGASAVFEFSVIPPQNPQKAELRAMVKANGKIYSLGVQELIYDHIPHTLMFPEARAELIHLDLKTKTEKVAYLHGAGDAVDEALVQMGFQVDVLNLSEINPESLGKYKAVVLGIRAFNTLENLPAQLPVLLKFVENGGNMIVQYNTTGGLPKLDFGPFPFKVSRDRVTDERAAVRMIEPGHKVFNEPNKLNADDFQGWVQERGLYFASDWAAQFTPLLEMADPDEQPMQGALIVAPYGKGNYVYTGISFFRQLPAGVPGAYRLLANLIAL